MRLMDPKLQYSGYPGRKDSRFHLGGCNAVDTITCTGSHVSNGRIVVTANGGGLQLSMYYGEEAERMTSPWTIR